MTQPARQPQQNVPRVTLPTQGMELVRGVAYNVEQHVIVVTRDKCELCLRRHVSRMEQRRTWLVPMGLCVSTGITLLTTTFRDAMGIKAEGWRSIFIIAFAAAGVWLVVCLFRLAWAKSVDDVIDELAAGSFQPTMSTPESLVPRTPPANAPAVVRAYR